MIQIEPLGNKGHTNDPQTSHAPITDKSLVSHIRLSETEARELADIGALIEGKTPEVLTRWQDELSAINGLPGVSFKLFCSIFKVLLVELCPHLRQHRYREYLGQLLVPAVEDVYAFGVGSDYLASVFHTWEKSLYPVVEKQAAGPGRALRYILRLDHFFHIMLTTALSTYMKLETEQNPFEPIVHMTPRQKDILTRLAQGQQNKEIAQVLGLSSRTVEGHRMRLMHKVGATSLAELIRFGIRSRLVNPGIVGGALSLPRIKSGRVKWCVGATLN